MRLIIVPLSAIFFTAYVSSAEQCPATCNCPKALEESIQRERDLKTELEQVKNAKIQESFPGALGYLAAQLNGSLNAIKEQITEMRKNQDVSSDNIFQKIDALSRVVYKSSFKVTILPSGNKLYIPLEAVDTKWVDAKDYCAEFGLSLVTVKTQDQLDEYFDAAKDLGNSVAWWVSASDFGQENGNFKWQDGTELFKNSSLWYTGWPGDYGPIRKSCVHFNVQRPKKLLNYYCDHSMRYACE